MTEIFTRTYDDGKVVESMLNPDRLDSPYEKIRDIHKKEFPDWKIPQLLRALFNWDRTLLYREYMTDDEFISLLQKYADENNEKLAPFIYDGDDKDDEKVNFKPILTQETQCTENP